MSALTKWNPFKETDEMFDWGLTRWNPLREMEQLHNRIERLFGPSLAWPMKGKGETMTLTNWEPLVDITEDEKEYLVKMELPEVKKEEVKVTVQEGVLSITGERKFEKEEKDKKYHRIERAYGSFERSFTLPEGTDASKVTSEFKDGVLKVHLPKSPSAKPKAIEIKVD